MKAMTDTITPAVDKELLIELEGVDQMKQRAKDSLKNLEAKDAELRRKLREQMSLAGIKTIDLAGHRLTRRALRKEVISDRDNLVAALDRLQVLDLCQKLDESKAIKAAHTHKLETYLDVLESETLAVSFGGGK